MTWFEFRSKVDEYLAENSLDPQEVEIWYLEMCTKVEDLEIGVDEISGLFCN